MTSVHDTYHSVCSEQIVDIQQIQPPGSFTVLCRCIELWPKGTTAHVGPQIGPYEEESSIQGGESEE